MKPFELANAATWSKLADWYESTFMKFDLYNSSYDRLIELLAKREAKIFEIGCGPGNICYYMTAKEPQWRWTGTDLVESMLEVARTYNSNQEFMRLAASELQSIQTTYDALVMGFCLPYIPNDELEQLFSNAIALIHDNGYLYISFVIGDTSDSLIQKNSNGDSMYFFFHEIEPISTLLKSKGLSLVWQQKLDYTSATGRVEEHAVLIFKK